MTPLVYMRALQWTRVHITTMRGLEPPGLAQPWAWGWRKGDFRKETASAGREDIKPCKKLLLSLLHKVGRHQYLTAEFGYTWLNISGRAYSIGQITIHIPDNEILTNSYPCKI